jgi:hypothetical protein
MNVSTNGAATKGREEASVQSIASCGNFVRTSQRFIGALGNRRAWNCYLAVVALVVLCLFAIFGEVILNLQNQLALRQPVIVGLTTAHALVPLFPDGTAAVTCDALCIDGQLEAWVVSFRTITGEQDLAQTEQHREQAKAASMIAVGSDAEKYAKGYYATFNPYALSAKGAKLEVRGVHVSEESGIAGRYDAHWTDVVSNMKTGHEMARRNFSAYIDATSIPGARTEQNVMDNPGGVVITHVEQYGVTP